LAKANAGFPAASADGRQYVRALRWVFRRGADLLACELGLTALESAYELRITVPGHPERDQIEIFDDAMGAFQRHAMIERALVEDGWSLDTFESRRGA
jgi:hypothetical protein